MASTATLSCFRQMSKFASLSLSFCLWSLIIGNWTESVVLKLYSNKPWFCFLWINALPCLWRCIFTVLSRHNSLKTKEWFSWWGFKTPWGVWVGHTFSCPLVCCCTKGAQAEPGKFRPKRVNDNKRQDNRSVLGKKDSHKGALTCLSCILAEAQTTNSDTSKDPGSAPRPLPRDSCSENIIIHLLVFSCTFEVKVWSG